MPDMYDCCQNPECNFEELVYDEVDNVYYCPICGQTYIF